MSLPARYLPPVNRCLARLDKDFFTKHIPLVVVGFSDPRNIHQFIKQFKEEVLGVPRIPYVVKLDTNTLAQFNNHDQYSKDKPPATGYNITKGILLKDSIHNVEDVDINLSKEALHFLHSTGAQICNYSYRVDYNFYKADEIFRAILPDHLQHEIPSGFTVTGHIAHFNLKAEFKPFGHIIGQVILDKNSKIKTVVDKIDSIDTKFRTFHMNLLAGKDDLNVTLRESNCTFSFDFRKVYWNSRLHTEHERLVSLFKPHQLVADVFAGVGPFAIPAAKKNVFVLANDLNVHSYNSLKTNIATNKVTTFSRPFNLDGRTFINQTHMLWNSWRERVGGKVVIPNSKKYKLTANGSSDSTPLTEIQMPKFVHHYVMNLPNSAFSFLNEFVGLYSKLGLKPEILSRDPDFVLPWIHCHCFEKYDPNEKPMLTIEELEYRIYKRLINSMQVSSDILSRDRFHFHMVRKVAPTKPMFCVSFQLPQFLA